jgi:hypothetical protein
MIILPMSRTLLSPMSMQFLQPSRVRTFTLAYLQQLMPAAAFFAADL